jgi:hypothetical protein
MFGLLAVILALVPVASALAVSNFTNGFETNTAGWYDDGVEITRVPSGTHGITSATGAYHAEVKAGAFTDWGGYENTFPSDGYVTQIDIYLDMGVADGTDKRFDFSSAIGTPAGTHRRDFIFSLGTKPGVPGQWVMTASNNPPGWPSDPGRDPFTISQSG